MLGEYAEARSFSVYGLDIDLESLHFLQKDNSKIKTTTGNATHLPYRSGFFDLTFCHFLLLWLANPLKALHEIKRVTRQGGWVCTFAEPDYGGRIAYPQVLAELADWQTRALAQRGASRTMGRQLNSLFHAAGLKQIESGVLAAEWKGSTSQMESELQMMRDDLAAIGKEDLFMKAANQIGDLEEAVYFVPTFYAVGRA